ncbi:MAG: class I SAM-dependent methyltransferase [Desulfobulbaceae bacterium]
MSVLSSPCPACGLPITEAPFYRLAGVPANSVILCDTRNRALGIARGDIALLCCPACGLVFNRDYDPALCRYNEHYEESQSHSDVFTAFHRNLAACLVERHGLRNRTILEIGCGKGDFLNLLCRLGDNRGIGYDPSYVPSRSRVTPAERVTIHPCRFPKAYDGPAPDCIICKMTLEHIPDVHAFLRDVRATIRPGRQPVVVFQVPDSEPIFTERRFWDIYYEHCTYFTRTSLTALFARCGFQVLDLAGAYDRQYLVVTARPSVSPGVTPDDPEDAGSIATLAATFADTVGQDILDWRNVLQTRHRNGARIALWGGGSKAVAFLTTLEIGDAVQMVVDINPHKQNAYLPGTGHRVAAPEELVRLGADLVLAMNPVYLKEIDERLRSLGLSPLVLSPSLKALRLLVREGC